MSITSRIEETLGIDISTLNSEEERTYRDLLADVEKSQITPERLKDYIISMKTAVEQELINEPEFNYIFIFKVPNRKQILLKARLHNYILLESFLLSPERAKQQLESAIHALSRGR